MKSLRLALVSLAGLFAASAFAATTTAFTNWPAGTAPAEIGKRVAENFAARQFQWQTDPKRKYVIYPEICAWYGGLEVARLTGDADLQKRLAAKYDVLLTPEGAKRISPDEHVDYRIFGVVPLEINLLTKDPAFLAIGRPYADAQWSKPTPDGITHEARYWIDDMYMSPILQVQAFRATGESKYLDRAALMMAALLTHQAADGMWRQLVDKPESWAETSATGMFTFALVTGVKYGWLDETAYAPAARKAWITLVGYLDADANVREVCVGTNKSRQVTGTDDLKVQYDFYLARPRKTGDLHGQAPLLWTAAALLR
jgi:rhamnogalacturonyl hydrolase YesR